jgi:hypothetical protein
MEPVGAGASVIAFIALTLQSAKVISNFLAGIHGGPENVALAQSTVASLEGALTECPSLLSPSSPVNVNLEAKIKHFAEDIARFAAKLEGLRVQEEDGCGRRAWKRIKAAFGEKELDRMTRTGAAYASVLGLWMQVLER